MNRLVRTEGLKQRTTRSIVGGVVAAPVIAALVTVAVLGAAGKQGNDPLGPGSLAQTLGAPADIITLIALLLGVVAMAGEYRHQTITTTFLAVPRRRDVVMAKLFAQALTGAAMGVASLVVTIAIAVPWLQSKHVAIPLDAALLRVSAGLVVSAALYGALGVALGALIRNQTVAAAAVLVWLLAVEGIIRDAFAGSGFVRWLPAAAGRALVHVGSSGDTLSVPVAIGVFVAYVTVLAAVGVRFTVRRDIT